MSDFLNNNRKAEPVSDFADQPQTSCKSNIELNTLILPGFESWLIEY
jgi:hypothetical protein